MGPVLGWLVAAWAAPVEGACATSCATLDGLEQTCAGLYGDGDSLCDAIGAAVTICGEATVEEDCQALCDALEDLEDPCEHHDQSDEALCSDIDEVGDDCSDDLDDDLDEDPGDDLEEDGGSCGCAAVPGDPVLAAAGLVVIAGYRRRRGAVRIAGGP